MSGRLKKKLPNRRSIPADGLRQDRVPKKISCDIQPGPSRSWSVPDKTWQPTGVAPCSCFAGTTTLLNILLMNKIDTRLTTPGHGTCWCGVGVGAHATSLRFGPVLRYTCRFGTVPAGPEPTEYDE